MELKKARCHAALAGVLAGLAGAFLLSRSIESLLYGVTAYDPATFAAAVALLVAVAAAAVFVPARRATRVHPTVALRQE